MILPSGHSDWVPRADNKFKVVCFNLRSHLRTLKIVARFLAPILARASWATFPIILSCRWKTNGPSSRNRKVNMEFISTQTRRYCYLLLLLLLTQPYLYFGITLLYLRICNISSTSIDHEHLICHRGPHDYSSGTLFICNVTVVSCFCYDEIFNRFTCLAEYKIVKQEVSRTK